MKVILIASILVVAAQATSFSQYGNEWEKFKERGGKKYEDLEEDELRKKIFVKNVEFVEEHNKKYKEGKVSHTVRINKFSDLTQTEIDQMFKGYKPSNSSEGVRFKARANVQVPDSFDWRSKGAVTSVKNQGSVCGSCWAFSAVGALEGQLFLKHGKLVNVSVQNLVDCSTSKGCDGSLPQYAYDYIQANGGIDSQESYPYEAVDGKCRYKPEHSVGRISGYVSIQEGNETDLKDAVATAGPISVCINGNLDRFLHYDSGFFDHPECTQGPIDHCVLVVGYGTTPDGKDYWLVKNSWSILWGEQGYIRIARNKNNQCHIASEAIYPIAI